MQPPNAYFALPLIVSAMLFLAVAVYGLYRRRSFIAAALVALLAGDALWLGAHVVLMLSPDAAVRVFWAHVQATGILLSQVSWLVLVLLYTGDIRGVMRRWWAQAAICAPPLALLGALWLAPDKFYFGDWTTLELGSRLIRGLGPGFWLQAAWGEVTSAAGTLLLVLAYRRAARPRGTRDRVLIAAALLPWVASIGFLLNVRPFNLNLTPFGVALSGVLLAWGVLRHQWFGIVPTAQRVILESLTDGVVVVEREGRIADLNPAALAMLACTREEALDQPAVRTLAQRSEALAETLQQAAGMSEPALVAVDVAGAQRWYEVLVKPLYGWRGKRRGQLLTLHDVSERRAVEQALRQSEARYRLLAENVSDVIWTTDVAGHLTYVSPSVEELIGILPQETPSMTLEDLFSQSSVDLVRAAALAARQPGAAEIWQHEVEFRRKDGSTVWAEVKGNLLRAAAGQLVGVIGVARDIELRKRAEARLQALNEQLEALVAQRTAELVTANAELQREVRQRIEVEQSLRESHAHNAALLRAIPDVIWVVSSAGVLTDCWTGDVGQDAFVDCQSGNRELSAIVAPAIAGQIVAQARAALASGAVQRREYQIQQGARQQEYEARAVALADDQALVMLRNISEQKRLEQRLLREERLSALGRFAAELAHDLNNPLQIIQSHLDLLLDFPMKDAERREYLQVIRQQIQRLSRHVADALALTRPEPRRAPVVMVSEPADVTDIIQRVLALVSKCLRQGGIQVDADLTQTARTLIPSDQLMQVCLNLVVNAIEALYGRSDGRLQITIQPTGDALILSFCNNGPTIPSDVLPYIMEPFYTTKSHGSGLGLWVCCNILRKYGGALTARNLAGDQGVVFDLSLPAAA